PPQLKERVLQREQRRLREGRLVACRGLSRLRVQHRQQRGAAMPLADSPAPRHTRSRRLLPLHAAPAPPPRLRARPPRTHTVPRVCYGRPAPRPGLPLGQAPPGPTLSLRASWLSATPGARRALASPQPCDRRPQAPARDARTDAARTVRPALRAPPRFAPTGQ